MYAIVVFLRGKDKEYAVVPVIWLENNNSVCYWPKVKTAVDLEKLVKENSPYEKRWPKYSVHKVLKSSENYDSLQLELSAILEQSTTDSGTGSGLQAILVTDKPPCEQEIDSDNAPKTSHANKSKNKSLKRKHKSKSSKSKRSRSTKSESYPKKRCQSSSSSQSSGSENKENDAKHENGAEDRDTDTFSEPENSPKRALLSTNTTHSHNRGFEKCSDTIDNDVDKRTDNNNYLKSKNSPRNPIPSKSTSNFHLTRSESEHRTSDEDEYVPKEYDKCPKLKNLPKPQALFRSITHANLTRSPSLLKDITCSETSGKTGTALPGTPPNDRRQSPENSPQTPSITSTPRSSSHRLRQMPQQEFQVEVLTRFRILESELSQMNTSFSQLTRSLQMGNLQTAVMPDDFPSLPIASMKDFRNFDLLLKIEIYETYFTNRLAAIGGPSLRQGVMNAMKFALTNVVAMEFNWAGRDKKQPFQGTEMARIITAAIKIRYAESADATDIQIFSAIKDWLKQAKHRHVCQEKKSK